MLRPFMVLLLLSAWGFPHPASEPATERKKGNYSDFPEPQPVWTKSAVTMPFRFAGNLMLVSVNVDSLRGEFILDTGAPHLVLNKTWFRNYPKYGEIMASGISGSGATGNQTRVGKLDLDGLHFEQLDADVVELGHLEAITGTPVLGLLGLNLLNRLELTIDFEAGVLEWIPLNRQGMQWTTRSDTSKADQTVMLQPERRLMLADATVNGKSLRFCIDTGAETNILHSNVSNKALQDVKLKRRTAVTGSTREVSEALIGRIGNLNMAGAAYPQMPVSVMNISALRDAYQNALDGILGMDFLYRHRKISINLVQRKMRLWQRSE